MTDSAMLLPKRSREKDPQSLRWIKQQPEWQCLVTGRTDAVACHLRSVGAGESDYWVFPLIQPLHDESHRRPEFFCRYRKVMAEWFYRLPVLHARYQPDVGVRSRYEENGS